MAVHEETKVRTPLFPLYSAVRACLPLWVGVRKQTVLQLINDVRAQMGTPQDPVDWSNPDAWIGERLQGESEELARKIWTGTDRKVNPRHIYGIYLFVNTYALLQPDSDGVYRITSDGERFLQGDSDLEHRIDDAEGLLQLLAILEGKVTAKRSDLLPEWSEFLQEHSNYGTTSTTKDTLRRRLLNLAERGLATRDGNSYAITEAGRAHLAGFVVEENQRSAVLKTLLSYNKSQREVLREKLATVDPYRFEDIVRQLLEAMGYEDVEVTAQSGDKGVDVVATTQFGITTFREVIQVKRHQANIGRPVLDQLRGALPYHDALRGTIITLGSFSKGCQDVALFPGAAPIGLINGEKLLDLLIENQIGIRLRPAEFYELDDSFFAPADGSNAAAEDAEPDTSLVE